MPSIKSFSAATKSSFTFSLFTEIAFPCNSRFASPLDFRKPDFSDNKSIMLLPKTSDLATSACGTPSKICKNNSSSKLTKSSAVLLPKRISEAFNAFS